MKNKNKTYILLAVVLSIWVTIGYKMWTGFQPELPDIENKTFAEVFQPKQEATIDTFSIQKVQRDPFLGTLLRPKPAKNTPIKKQKPPIIWLPISYQGMITNQGSKQQLFVVTINNQQHLLQKGQTLNEITLVKGTAKHITVRYKNEQKQIAVQE